MDLAEFTGEQSDISLAKYGIESNAVSTLLGIPIAAAVDTGISIWNSVVPEQYEYDTRDVLGGINENLAEIYNQNEGTVKLLSFIGGVVVPGGIATKGMNLLRSGAKGVNWFSTAGQTARLAGIKTALENAGKASTAYRSLMWENRFATAGNALVDATVYEGVLLATMNAHPYMEDYLKDPIKNAGLSIAFGTGLLGAGGLIMQRYAVKGVRQEVAKASNDILLEKYVPVNITENLSGQLVSHSTNIENWTNLLATRTDLTQHTKSLVEFNIKNSAAAQIELFNRMIGGADTLPTGGQELKEHIIKIMASRPTEFQGVDAVRLVKIGEMASLDHIKKSPFLSDTVEAGNTGIPFLRKNQKTGRERTVSVVYNPEFDTFMRPEDLKHYGGAVDMGIHSVEDVLRRAPKNWHLSPESEVGIEAIKTSTPAMDLRYLQGLAYFDSFSDDALLRPVKIAKDDYAAIQGFITKVRNSNINPNDIKLELDGTKTTLIEAMQYLQAAKMAEADVLLRQGVPELVIAKRLNTELEFVQAIANGLPMHVKTNLDYMKYTDASAIGQILDIKNRSLLLRTNTNKIPHAIMRSNLGQAIARDADDVIKEGLFAASKSQYIRDWMKLLAGEDFRTLRDIVRNKLAITANEFMGTRFATSADHALRGMEEIGPIATQIGKDITELHLQAVNKFFAPVKDELLTLARDKVALTEFNIADHVNAKIKGYREFRDGSFWHPDPTAPTKIVKNANGKDVEVPNLIRAQYEGEDFIIKSESVLRVFDWISQSGRELYEQARTLRQVPGTGMFSDLGFWMPSFNPKDKYIAYVINKLDHTTTLLHSKTEEGLQDAIRIYKARPDVSIGRTHDIVERGTDQRLYNILQGRHDPTFAQSADVAMLHSGASANARPGVSAERLVDIINAYEHQLNYNIKSMAELQFSDVFDFLRQSSEYTQASVKGQPAASGIFRKTKPDAASVLMKTILGKSTIDESYLWRGTNQIYSAILEKGLNTIAEVMDPVLNVGKTIFGKGKSASAQDYAAYAQELEARGIPNPFAVFTQYEQERAALFHADRTAITESLAPRITVLANTMAATSLLRVGELGQAYVNAISLPILMTSEISSKLPAKFMGTDLVGRPELGAVKTIFDGWRYKGLAADPAVAKAKELNLFKGVVSEADELFRRTRSVDPGVLSATEDLLRSRTVEMLSKATDWSEQFVREKAFMTGLYIARKSYPGINDNGALIFARDFMERTIGNYSAAQRPTMFQGTFGVAMGLFQTYMLTMAQSLFRHLEKGEFKALAKAMLMQSTIFGAKSLPGFNIVSEAIGNHFSDDNVDPITGTFRDLPDGLAQSIIYGLPSNLPPAITTRGELQPRIPDPTQGINAIPAVNLTVQVYDAMRRVANSVFSVDKTAGQGIMEALTLQSISRPVARLAEFGTSHSITAKGNTIAGPEEIWTWNSAIARGFAARPISEVRARDAVHLNTVYGSIDRDRRQEITQQLRTHLRSGTLNPTIVSELAEQYMRTGSPSGWNSAVNTALAQTVLPSDSTVRNYLAPNSPTMALIDSMH